MKIILGSSNETPVKALRFVLGLPRYKKLSFESIDTRIHIIHLPVFGHERITELAKERAILAYQTTKNESHLGLGIQNGVTESAEHYVETTSIVLYFPDGKISSTSTSCAKIPRELFLTAHHQNESIDHAVAKAFQTQFSHDPIATLTNERLNRTTVLTESLKWLFTQTDWDQYIRLSSAPPA